MIAGSIIVLFLYVQVGCAQYVAPSSLLVDWKPSGYAQGIESRFPTFSWAVMPNCTDCWLAAPQFAYQILVASSLKLINADVGDIWDSGETYSNESSRVIYQNGNLAKSTSFSIHKTSFDSREDLTMSCTGNMHISSIDEFIWQGEGGNLKRQVTLEALNRRCKQRKACVVPSSQESAALVWTCAENPLQPSTTYYWKVRAWFGSTGNPLPYSEVSTFTTSLYGEWNNAVAIYGSSPSGFVYLRSEQNISNPESCTLQATTIFVTAAESNKLFSAYKLYVNNVWIGSGPGRNNSLNQQLYDSYDVYNIFQNYTQGAEIPVVLAAECFHLTSGAFQLSLYFQYLCSNSSVIVRNVLSSSDNWKAFPANTIYNPTGSSAQDYIQPHEYINGENWIDAWQDFGFHDHDWKYASVVTPFVSPLIAKPTLPVQVSVVPIANVTQVGPGHYFFYLEREVMGGLILTVDNPSTSANRIEIRLGEELDGPESVMYKMRTGNVYQDFWTLRPGENNLHHHEYMEWRYGEILNFTGTLEIDDVYAWVYNYPFDDSLSSFNTSHPQLQAIYDLCKYTIKASSLDLLTDSNTRERQPYEADMYITSLSMLSVMPSFALVRATLAWLLEFPTWPTEWHLLTNSAAWLDYMSTGDPWIAENFWSTLTANSFINQYFNKTLGLIEKPVDASNGINDLVDWPAIMRDGYVMTNVDTVINAHAYHAATILASLAQVTNNTSEISFFQKAAEQMYQSVNSRLVNSSGIYVDGLNLNHTAAHASAFALSFGLVNYTNYAKIVAFLLAKGMVGSPYFAHFLLEGLYNSTAAGVQGAFDLITSTGENSWLAMLDNGATMTSEMWNAKEKPNMSWSHPWSTTPLIMITSQLMGVTWLGPSCSIIKIAPKFPTSIPLNASIAFPTIKGTVSISIRTILNDDPSDKLLAFSEVEMEYTIPANIWGELEFYFGSDEMKGEGEKKRGKGLVRVMADGKEIEEVWVGRKLVVEQRITAGKHRFVARKRT